MENFQKRAILKLNEDITATLLLYKTPELLSNLSINEQASYQLLKNSKKLTPPPFPNPDEIKEKYGESNGFKVQSHLELLTSLQRRLQYLELSEFISPINNTFLAIPSTNILPPLESS